MRAVLGLALLAFSVGTHAGQTPSVENRCSFWDLAAKRVPAAFNEATALVNLTADTGPEEVKPLRVSLLQARELLDIFAAAYNKSFYMMEQAQPRSAAHQSPHDLMTESTSDHWFELRKDLDAGYEVLGNFQDLAHSLVNYTAQDVVDARERCLAWMDTFSLNSLRFGYPAYVQEGLCASGSFCKHKHESKFFWGYKGCQPSAGLSGAANLVHLLRDSQLAQLVDNITHVLSLEDIYLDPQHNQFHLFRKLIRSVLAVLEAFPELLSGHSSKKHHSEQIMPAEGTAQESWAVATLRSWLQGVAVWWDSQLHHQKHGKGKDGRENCDARDAVSVLQLLFKNLGQINNKIFAYQFYKKRGELEVAELAKQTVNKEWAAVRLWMVQVKLNQQASCIASSLQS